MGPPDTFGAEWLMDLHATHVGGLFLIYEDEGVVFQSSFIGKLPSGSIPDDCLIIYQARYYVSEHTLDSCWSKP